MLSGKKQFGRPWNFKDENHFSACCCRKLRRRDRSSSQARRMAASGASCVRLASDGSSIGGRTHKRGLKEAAPRQWGLRSARETEEGWASSICEPFPSSLVEPGAGCSRTPGNSNHINYCRFLASFRRNATRSRTCSSLKSFPTAGIFPLPLRMMSDNC